LQNRGQPLIVLLMWQGSVLLSGLLQLVLVYFHIVRDPVLAVEIGSSWVLNSPILHR